MRSTGRAHGVVAAMVVARAWGLKVFAATKSKDCELLGDRITEWIRSNPKFDVVDKLVLQSSDAEYHCLTIVLLYSF